MKKTVYRCGRPARQCATPGCVNVQGRGHSALLHAKVDGKRTGACGEPGCKCHAFTQRKCRKIVLEKGAACKFHGGNAKRGPESPTYKTGVHSKYANGMSLIGKLNEYQAAVDNPDILSMKDEIAVVDVYLTSIVQSVIGIPVVTLDALKLAVQSYAIAKHGSAAKDKAYDKITRLLDDAGQQNAAREEFFRVIDIRRKLTSSEMRRETATLGMVPLSMVLSVIQSVADAIKTDVTNIEDRIRIFARLDSITAGRVAPAMPTVTDVECREEPGRSLGFVRGRSAN